MLKEVSINNRLVGDGHPAYIIAEMSGNHAGSMDRALEIIHAAKESGADCIKIQTYTPDTLTIDCHNKYFDVKNGTWEGENLYSLYGKAYTPWEWQPRLFEEAKKVGIDFLSTPFDKTSVDFLEDMGLSFYKIASFEMIDLPLISYIASKGKPIILSTGMGTLEEMKEAVETVKAAGNDQLILLKCASAYPAISDDMHLATIADMKRRFDIPVGLSDHSMGFLGATTAVALGANVIEKHFCMGREIENPDASFSMTPDEFKLMVANIREAEKAIGVPTYGISKGEEASMVFRRSVFAVKDIKKGETFTDENTRIIRPGYGMKPKYMHLLVGNKADSDIDRGTPLDFSYIGKGKIIFASNNENARPLYNELCKLEGNDNVLWFDEKIDASIVDALEPSWIISFNYKHMIKKDVLDKLLGHVINLHTSYLPYNRGSSPNFFSFLDETPKGVTVHLMDEGLDTGDILVQKEIKFDEETETFATSYNKLIDEIAKLFLENWSAIKAGRITPTKQSGPYTYHRSKDLDNYRRLCEIDWNMNIKEYKDKAFSQV